MLPAAGEIGRYAGIFGAKALGAGKPLMAIVTLLGRLRLLVSVAPFRAATTGIAAVNE